jgi:uncharacterized protein YceH (UPF0502 family)
VSGGSWPLSDAEARVLGSLIEKQLTTPEQYPLSLNALVNACNQKSNREPVLQLAEAEVQALVDGLVRRHLVLERGGFGSRVPKYQQTFCNAEFGQLKFSPQELAIVCELLLRGPQTPGELRSRAARMAAFADSGEVEAALVTLAARSEGPVVKLLAREPGRREARWAQLYTALPESAEAEAPRPPVTLAAVAGDVPLDGSAQPEILERIAKLEALVEAVRLQLQALQDKD